MPARAFVAGATGYTGHEVVRALRSRGVETVAHVRPDSARLGEWRGRFAELGARVDATPWEDAAMHATLGALAPTIVFALLGTTRKRARAAGSDAHAESYEKVDLGLTTMLVRAAAASGTRPRFVYLSAIGAGPNARGAYLRARVDAERVIRDSGLPFTIARPTLITGPDREESRPAERFLAALSDGALSLASALGARSWRDRFRSTTAAELAEALVRHALDPASENVVLEADRLRAR